MANLEIHYSENGGFDCIKISHRTIRHAKKGETVKFIIPASSSYKKLLIQRGGIDSNELFGNAKVDFNSSNNLTIQDTAHLADYTFTPVANMLTDPNNVPDTGTIKVGS